MHQASGQDVERGLRELSRLHGLRGTYVDAKDRPVRVPTENLARILELMGVETRDPGSAIAARRAELEGRRAPEATAAWDGRLATPLRLGDRPTGRLACRIEIDPEAPWEGGGAIEWTVDAQHLPARLGEKPGADEGETEPVRVLTCPTALPIGYHTLRVGFAGLDWTTTVISTPARSYGHGPEVCDHEWGLFCPLYALRTGRDTGCGDLTDLRALARWQRSRGGRVAATLPLLAVYLDEPFDPSPYAPVSKLFWNEVFVDPSLAEDFASCAGARERVASEGFRREVESLRSGEMVQYRRQAQVRRSVLEPIAERFFASGGEDRPSFASFVERTPDARSYARFRAVVERQRSGWTEWTDALRGGRLHAGDYDERAERYHLFAQYEAVRQLDLLHEEMSGEGSLLYLDLPVGVRENGFDVWRWPDLFVRGISVGAPPDPFFTKGQRWGFPPLHPDRVTSGDGLAYVIRSLRNHMRWSDFLRLDHVMGFYRLFLAPVDADAKDGAYVHYPDEALFAVLCLESHRNRCRLVGENLGTVPEHVNAAMERHGMAPLYVAQYEVGPESESVSPVPAGCVASLNTHDMPPFAKYFSGADVADRVSMGIFDAEQAEEERSSRGSATGVLERSLRESGKLGPGAADAGAVRDATMRHLADSDAAFVLANIEDLWLETQWQNVPGTVDEYPNWRRRLRYELDEMSGSEDVARQLGELERIRGGRREEARVVER